MRYKCSLLSLLFSPLLFSQLSYAVTPLAYWQFQDGLPGTIATTLSTYPESSSLDGIASKTSANVPNPIFDPEVPGKTIYDSKSGGIINADNTTSLRLTPLPEFPAHGGRAVINGTGLVGIQDFTFELFVNINNDLGFSMLAGVAIEKTVTKNQMTWGLHTDGGNGNLSLRIDNEGVANGLFNQSIKSASEQAHIADQNWHHIAFSYESATTTARLYVDYQLVAEKAEVGQLIFDGGNLYVGKFSSSSGIGAFFDEPRLTESVLHPDEFMRSNKVYRRAITFNRHELFNEDHLADIINAGNLRAKKVDPVTSELTQSNVTGSFEYDMIVPLTGWYELLVYADRSEYKNSQGTISRETRYGTGVEYIITRPTGEKVILNGMGYNQASSEPSMKVANVWLVAGKNTLQVSTWYWTGMHPLTAFELSYIPESGPENLDNHKIDIRRSDSVSMVGPFLAKGSTLDLEIDSGLQVSGRLDVEFYTRNGSALGALISTHSITLPVTPAGQMSTTIAHVPVTIPGNYIVKYSLNGTQLKTRDVHEYQLDVIDTGFNPTSGIETLGLAKTLVASVDCSKGPDYSEATGAGNPTGLVNSSIGDYWESGDIGMRQGTLSGSSPHSWFAYRLPYTMQPGTTYLVEVDVPDNTHRTMTIGIHEGHLFKGNGYTLTSGVDTGNQFSNSNSIITHGMLFWPRSNSEPRVVLRNAQTGQRAACSKIRLYAINTSVLPPLLKETNADIASEGLPRRQFAYWYEEADNWPRIFGGIDASRIETIASVERWLQTLHYMGGDTVIVTGVFYGPALLYPSRNYNRNETAPQRTHDWMRMVLLLAEKYSIKVIVDMHPRAHDLHMPDNDFDIARKKLLIHKDNLSNNRLRNRNNPGHPETNIPGGMDPRVQPMFNPLHPEVQAWYRGMIKEFSARYADSPAFAGVSLRLMSWQNGSFNNFSSLDWGYGDTTAALFSADSGIDLSTSTPQQRYETLTSPVWKNIWLNWRSHKITNLFGDIATDINSTRQASMPKLTVYALAVGEIGKPDTGMLSSGIDPAQIFQHPDVEVINMRHHHGRGQGRLDIPNTEIENQRARDHLLDPADLGWATVAGRNIISGSTYFEDNSGYPNSFVSQDAIGFTAEANFDTAYSKTSGHVAGGGRHALERFAVGLAETDAKMLGDGGNAYYYGQTATPNIDEFQPLLHEFLREFRSLPAAQFIRREDASDPAAVWVKDNHFIYVVNRERYPVTVEIKFNGKPELVTLSDGLTLETTGPKLMLALKPYQLISFKDIKALGIQRIITTIPHEELIYVQDLVAWLENFSNTAINLQPSSKDILVQYAIKARIALDNADYWRARTIVEHHELKVIYQIAGVVPPIR